MMQAVKIQDNNTALSHPGRTQSLGGWFLFLCAALFLLVVVGGTVRITDSGLSIPEWPIINGSLLPPFTAQGWQTVYETYYLRIHQVDLKTLAPDSTKDLLTMAQFRTMFFIEYGHRFLAALVSIIFITLLTQVVRSSEFKSRFGRRMWGLLALLLTQAILGGIVVKYDLKAEFVAVHLGIAFVFFGALLWIAFSLLRPGKATVGSKPVRLAWIAAAAVYFQVLLGGMVAATKAGYFLNTWPAMGDHLIPPGLFSHAHLLIQFAHRWVAAVVVILVSALAVVSLRAQLSALGRLAMRAVMSVVVLQFLLGVATLIMMVPKGLAILHLATGLILFANLILITYELTYHAKPTA